MTQKKQDKNTQLIKFILSALVKMANLKGIKQLAEHLEQSPGKVYGWVRNGRISDVSCVLIKFPQVNREWLETGRGPMLRADAPRREIVQAVDIPIELSEKSAEFVGSWVEPYANEEESDQAEWSLEEMLEKATAVLQSKTIYRSALAANVRAFYQAVENEGEMRTTRETLTRLESKMARLEQLILNMANPAAEKREQAGG